MKNSKFSESCEDAESLNLSEQNSLKEQNSASALNLNDANSKVTLNLNDQNLSSQSFAAIGIASMSNLDGENSATGATALNFKNKNSATTDIVATSKTMAGAAKTGSYNERRRSKNDENSAKRY
ncbi:hypothetical protein [uncultured Campylobacter sp.]|uniref:hypothetical protein n=1 Tax=uncultured Campylobacter sp. TaxID=218934 RepID=UPI00260902B3|nr:hypothetical protein [uncultured Campylobacter sp.]